MDVLIGALPQVLFYIVVFGLFVFVVYYFPLLAKDSKKRNEQNEEIIRLLKDIRKDM
ncbi:hypothetical protein J7E71_13005 [Mesobacillus foraminis]|uniref:hypothetical protein n=1 Tax=Mesobacillus foraminis TaxID=279826 RepID=UPI001BE89F1A|nr:hypothetical protein [Mesobacillus foraminis]MBT2756866.1 hypothetical protein [Mesobacillus foraminis]